MAEREELKEELLKLRKLLDLGDKFLMHFDVWMSECIEEIIGSKDTRLERFIVKNTKKVLTVEDTDVYVYLYIGDTEVGKVYGFSLNDSPLDFVDRARECTEEAKEALRKIIAYHLSQFDPQRHRLGFSPAPRDVDKEKQEL